MQKESIPEVPQKPDVLQRLHNRYLANNDVESSDFVAKMKLHISDGAKKYAAIHKKSAKLECECSNFLKACDCYRSQILTLESHTASNKLTADIRKANLKKEVEAIILKKKKVKIGFFIKRARVAQHTFGDYNYHLDRFALLNGF